MIRDAAAAERDDVLNYVHIVTQPLDDILMTTALVPAVTFDDDTAAEEEDLVTYTYVIGSQPLDDIMSSTALVPAVAFDDDTFIGVVTISSDFKTLGDSHLVSNLHLTEKEDVGRL